MKPQPQTSRHERSVAAKLDSVEGKVLKCALPDPRAAQGCTERSPHESNALQEVSCDAGPLAIKAGPLVVRALKKSGYTKERAAREMGISASLFTRQLQNVDNQHLSLQRLLRLDDKFWRELWVLLAVRRRLARARRRVVFDFGAAS